MFKYKRIIERLAVGVGLVCLAVGVFGVSVGAQNVPQGYQSDATLQKGLLVRLKDGDGTKVVPLEKSAATKLLGVVVSATDAPVSLSNNPDERQVFVATAGKYEALVSDQGGTIAVGDYIAVSSLTGVGMKAAATDTVVLGKALTAFNSSKAESSATLAQSSGSKKTVAVGRVSVDLGVGSNPLYQAEPQPGVPRALARAAQVVTDRPVSAVRIYAGLGVMVVTVIIAGSILYAGVRTGMTAIGRNPLAKHTILRSLLTVTLLSLIIFGVGLTAVYVILRI